MFLSILSNLPTSQCKWPKISILRKWSNCIIKSKGKEEKKNMQLSNEPLLPDPLGGTSGQKFSFRKWSSCILNVMGSRITCKQNNAFADPSDPPPPLPG